MTGEALIQFLRCTKDGGTFVRKDDRLVCTTCDQGHPIIDDIVRFVPDDQYVSSFSHQWLFHEGTVIDRPDIAGGYRESEAILRGGFGLTPDLVRGKLVLDAGCGSGRFTEVLSRWGARVISVDLSRAVEACRRNSAGRESVLALQADILNLPLAEQTFDIVYSNGVLHHTIDTRSAFHAVSKLVKDGGFTTVYLYGDYGNARWMDRWRTVTTRMPRSLLHTLCWVSVPAWYLRQVPGLSLLGTAIYKFLPMSTHKDPRTRHLLTFDTYAPKYRYRHTYPEVYGWFVDEGYTDIKLYETQLIVSGWMDRANRRVRPGQPVINPAEVPLTTDRRDRAYRQGQRGLD